MEYRSFPNCGLQLSRLGLGSYYTFGTKILDQSCVNDIVKCSLDLGINHFDTAEIYGYGRSEEMLGSAFKHSGVRRSDFCIASKIFFGSGGKGPNAYGLSRKHIIEATKESLNRLQLDSIDIMYCHRQDDLTPVEETVRAMNYCIQQGYFYYWGTSSWDVSKIKEAQRICDQLGLIPPVVEQLSYNMFDRDRLEKLYVPEFPELGFVTFCPLMSGMFTGKYKSTIPNDSRLQFEPGLIGLVKRDEFDDTFYNTLDEISNQLDCTNAQFSIGWCLKNSMTTSTLMGVTNLDQLKTNIKALEVSHRITPEYMEKIKNILPAESIDPIEYDFRSFANSLSKAYSS